MTIWRKIKEIVSGVAYGSIDQKLSQQQKLIYGFLGLIIAIAAQVALAGWLIPNRALLNIVVFPFQLIGIFSLIYVVQGVTKYPFEKGSFWHLDTEKYVPFFIRARAFMYQPYVIIFILSQNLTVYMDSKTDYPYFYFSLILNNVFIIIAIIRYLEKIT